MNTTGKIGEISLKSTPKEILALDHEYFPHPWSAQQWKDLNPAQHYLFTYSLNEIIIGFALFSVVPGDDVAHLYKILLNPIHRASGISHQFWSEIVLLLKSKGVGRVYLEVESGNLAAIGFYKKEGFKLLRTNQGYYSNGDDALIMESML